MDLDRLRRETAVDHRSVETAFPLMAADLRVEQYVGCLQQLHGLVAEWERHAFESASPWLQTMLEERQRSTMLERDLAWFGVAADPYDRPSLLEMNDEATLLGAAYVMEGSKLGGRFIARHLETVLGLIPGSGDAYFRGHAERTGPMWKEFCAAIESRVPDQETDTVIQSAKAMFQIFGAWMLRPRAETALLPMRQLSHTPDGTTPQGLAEI